MKVMTGEVTKLQSPHWSEDGPLPAVVGKGSLRVDLAGEKGEERQRSLLSLASRKSNRGKRVE
jgi:hypothetical protein